MLTVFSGKSCLLPADLVLKLVDCGVKSSVEIVIDDFRSQNAYFGGNGHLDFLRIRINTGDNSCDGVGIDEKVFVQIGQLQFDPFPHVIRDFNVFSNNFKPHILPPFLLHTAANGKKPFREIFNDFYGSISSYILP